MLPAARPVRAAPDLGGVPIPGTEAWIEDADGNVPVPGAVGEPMVRGTHVMSSTGTNPRRRRRRPPGRWPWERVLATGDLFRTDEEGYLYFVSRRDDIIKSRGEKVVPKEIEDLLHTVPEVREAAVVGIPTLLGEAVIDVAPHSDAELDPGELRRLCAERLEDYMVPKRIVVHDELPRTGREVDRDPARALSPAAAFVERPIVAGARDCGTFVWLGAAA